MEGNFARTRNEQVEPADVLAVSRLAGSMTGDHSLRSALSAGLAGLGLLCIALALLAGAMGCQNQVSLIPNSDPALRKSRTDFARDGINRHPYHADAPRGGKIQGGAATNYEANTLQIANFTAEDWKDVEIWVNGQWVVFVPVIPGNAQTARTLNFEMMYDRMGRHFPLDNKDRDTMVQKVEIYRDGTMYELAGLSIE